MDIARLFVCDEVLKIREGFFVDCKVLVALHVVDVEVNAVKRNICPVVVYDHILDSFGVVIAPAALLVAECPERRNVALTDDFAELADYLNGLVLLDDVDVKVRPVDRDLGGVGFCVADIPADPGGEVDENAVPAENQEVMRGVERLFCLGVEGIVAAVALVNPAALVDTARSLSETVDYVVVSHFEGENELSVLCFVLKGKVRKIACGNGFNDRFGVDRLAHSVSFYHKKLSSSSGIMVLLYYETVGIATEFAEFSSFDEVKLTLQKNHYNC